MRHLHEALTLLGVTALCVSASVCQNPVPTRVKLQNYGAASGIPSPVDLALDLDATGPEQSVLRISHGQPRGLAALLFGIEAADLTTAYGARLLVMPVVAVAGSFDAQGSFAIPVDIANPAFVGRPLYAQGACYVPEEKEVFQLTQGLETTFFAGNEQPTLAYAGPPLTAVLIARADARIDTKHELACEIMAPTSAWTLVVQGTHTDGGVTAIYMILEAPSPDEAVLPVLSPLRTVVDMGFAAAPRIEVLIERRTRAMQAPPAFVLAAAIDRDF